jgi:hypothetical protein
MTTMAWGFFTQFTPVHIAILIFLNVLGFIFYMLIKQTLETHIERLTPSNYLVPREFLSLFIDKSLKRLYRVGRNSSGRSAIVVVTSPESHKHVVNILKTNLRKSDIITIENEYIICYMDEIANERSVMDLIERVSLSFKQHYDNTIHFGVNVSKYDTTHDVEELINGAKEACEEAKTSKKTIVFKI